MDLSKLIPNGCENNLCIGCVPKDEAGKPPAGHTWSFRVCGTCGDYRICLEKSKLPKKPAAFSLTGE